MPEYLKPEQVAILALGSSVAKSKEFGEAALRVGEPVLITGPAPRKDAWHTYRVRLKRFLDGEGPHCEGLEEFVEKLDGPGPIQMLNVREPHKTWLALLEADNTLSAITTVEKPRANR